MAGSTGSSSPRGKPEPSAVADAEVTRRLPSLAVDYRVSASTRNPPQSTPLFPVPRISEPTLSRLNNLHHAKRPAPLPVVLTREEVQALPAHRHGTSPSLVTLFYGPGPGAWVQPAEAKAGHCVE